jgi:hypothetical protein
MGFVNQQILNEIGLGVVDDGSTVTVYSGGTALFAIDANGNMLIAGDDFRGRQSI